MSEGSGRHRSSTVRFDGTHYQLTCDCGWQAPPMATPESVGDAWDDHRRVAVS
jgi:hypothetical protein